MLFCLQHFKILLLERQHLEFFKILQKAYPQMLATLQALQDLFSREHFLWDFPCQEFLQKCRGSPWEFQKLCLIWFKGWEFAQLACEKSLSTMQYPQKSGFQNATSSLRDLEFFYKGYNLELSKFLWIGYPQILAMKHIHRACR